MADLPTVQRVAAYAVILRDGRILLSRLSDTVGGAHSSRRSGLGNPYFVTGPWAIRISSVTADPCSRSGTHVPRRMSVR